MKDKKKYSSTRNLFKKRSIKRVLLFALWLSVISFVVLVLGTAIFLLLLELLREDVLTRKELMTSTLLSSVVLILILLSTARYLKRFKRTLVRWTRKSLKILAPLVVVALILTIISIQTLEDSWNSQNINANNTVNGSELQIEASKDFESLSFDIQQLLNETNLRRSDAGIGVLALNGTLNTAAKNKCDDMVAKNYWSHNDPAGNEPWYFMTNVGYEYEWAGENLAFGYNTEKNVIEGWMASELHKNNLLDSKYSDVGFGMCKSENFNDMGKRLIVVQFFGKPKVYSAPVSKNSQSSEQQKSNNSSKCGSLYSTYYTVPMSSLGAKPTSTYIIHYIGEDDYDQEVSRYNSKVAIYNSNWQKNKSKFLNEASIAKCDISIYSLLMDGDEARPYPVN